MFLDVTVISVSNCDCEFNSTKDLSRFSYVYN